MTQTQEPTELDCSAGAKMLIERMKTNPEDFDFGGKLYSVHERRHMSARDKDAVLDAYDKYIIEPKFMAEVLLALTTPVETEEQSFKAYTSGRSSGKSMLGNAVIDSRAIYGNQPASLYGTATARLEGASIYDSNTLTTYNTATQQRIAQEMFVEQQRAIADQKEKMRYLQEREERAAREGKLSWSDRFKGMF